MPYGYPFAIFQIFLNNSLVNTVFIAVI